MMGCLKKTEVQVYSAPYMGWCVGLVVFKRVILSDVWLEKRVWVGDGILMGMKGLTSESYVSSGLFL